jgi:hypothetical protein
MFLHLQWTKNNLQTFETFNVTPMPETTTTDLVIVLDTNFQVSNTHIHLESSKFFSFKYILK